MSDDGPSSRVPPPSEPLPTLAYRAPTRFRRRPVAGALAIIAALVCLVLAFSFGAAAFASFLNRQWLPFGMLGIFSLGSFVACQTLVKTAITLIGGHR